MADTHTSAQRLYAALQAVDPSAEVNQTYVAKRLNESAQTVNNWDTRGVSVPGAVKAQRLFSISCTWILDGAEPMLLSQSHSERLLASTMQAAIRLARQAVELRGMDDFDPEADELDAAILAQAIMTVLEQRIVSVTDSEVVRFARSLNKSETEGGKETGEGDRSTGRVGRSKGSAKAGEQSASQSGGWRKSAA
ncbi:hypothetical protein [Lysobacter fragariae]